MLKLTHFSRVLLATLLSISFVRSVNAESTATLTVVVEGINNQNGQICLGVYSRAKGFPMSTEDVLKSACVQPQGNTVTHKFSGLKA